MPVGYDRDGAVAGSTGSAAVPTFAYAYPGGTLQSASIGDLTAGQLEANRVEGAAARDRAPRRRAEMAGREAPVADLGWEPSPVRAGWLRTSPPSSRALGIAWIEVDGRPGRSPEPVSAAPARPLRPLLRLARDPPARTADPLGLQRLLPPDRPRPGPHPHPGRAAGARTPAGRRLQEPRPARRRADDRDGRDRVALRVFDAALARGRALHARLGARGSRCPSRPAELAQGTLVIADERGPSACSSASPPPRRPRSAPTPVASSSSPCRSRACPRPRSTRRCGSPAPRLRRRFQRDLPRRGLRLTFPHAEQGGSRRVVSGGKVQDAPPPPGQVLTWYSFSGATP